MERYELPARPEGTAQEQITQLWEALFRLVERLNAQTEETATGRRSVS